MVKKRKHVKENHKKKMEQLKKKKRRSHDTLNKRRLRDIGIKPTPTYDYQIKSDNRPSYKDISVDEGGMLIVNHIKNVLEEYYSHVHGLSIYVGKAVLPRKRWIAHQDLKKRKHPIKYTEMIVLEVFTDDDIPNDMKARDSLTTNENLCLLYERMVLHILNYEKIPNARIVNDQGGSGGLCEKSMPSTSLYVLIGEPLVDNENAREKSNNESPPSIIDISDSFNEIILNNNNEMSSSTMSL